MAHPLIHPLTLEYVTAWHGAAGVARLERAARKVSLAGEGWGVRGLLPAGQGAMAVTARGLLPDGRPVVVKAATVPTGGDEVQALDVFAGTSVTPVLLDCRDGVLLMTLLPGRHALDFERPAAVAAAVAAVVTFPAPAGTLPPFRTSHLGQYLTTAAGLNLPPALTALVARSQSLAGTLTREVSGRAAHGDLAVKNVLVEPLGVLDSTGLAAPPDLDVAWAAADTAATTWDPADFFAIVAAAGGHMRVSGAWLELGLARFAGTCRQHDIERIWALEQVAEQLR